MENSKLKEIGSGLNTVGDGLATVGRVSSIIKLIGAVVFGAIFIIVGVVLITIGRRRTAKYKSTIGTVVSKNNCETRVINRKVDTTCVFNIDYMIGDVKRTNILPSNRNYVVGQNIKIYYNIENIDDIAESNGFGIALAGSASIVVAILGICIMALITYFTTKYKAFATVSGVGTIADVFFRK